jgi:hypothetical protein
MHAGTQINEPIWSFDQNSQNIRRERIDTEYARHAALRLNPPLLAITDPALWITALK